MRRFLATVIAGLCARMVDNRARLKKVAKFTAQVGLSLTFLLLLTLVGLTTLHLGQAQPPEMPLMSATDLPGTSQVGSDGTSYWVIPESELATATPTRRFFIYLPVLMRSLAPTTPTPSSTPTSTPTTCTICVLVFNDLNSNAQRDGGEPLLAGATITVSTISSILIGVHTTDGVNEPYCFTGLAPDTYQVEEQNPAGYPVSITPDIWIVPLSEGSTTIAFGDQPPPKPTPTGTITSTPAATATATATLTPTVTATPTSTRTPTSTPTSTSSRTPTVTPTPTATGTPTRTPTRTPTLTPTNTPTSTPTTGTICILAFNDLNGNSQRDTGEPLLAGATITVTNSSGAVVGVRTTDGVHEPHCFSGLAPDNYQVQEQNPPGYPISTTPDPWAVPLSAGSTATAAFGDQALPTPTPTVTRTSTPTLTPTPATGTICVLAFNDRNGNGQRDTGEPLLAGATITVSTLSGILIGIYTTDGVQEPHCFVNLVPDTYRVEERNPAGYAISTTADVWAVLVSAGSTTTIAFGDQALPTSTPTSTRTRTPTLTPTPTLTGTPTRTPTRTPTLTPASTPTHTPTVTPTLTPTSTPTTGTICVLAFNDLNGNSQLDDGEPLLAGATITVTNSSGVVVGTYTTDGVHEAHCFPNLAPDNYRVEEQNPTGYPISTTPDVWSVPLSAGNTVTIAFGDQALPTATPTPSNTLTPTVTATPSSTRTSTPTRTPTSTRTPTATRTSTATPTATPTPTTTRTPTATATPFYQVNLKVSASTDDAYDYSATEFWNSTYAVRVGDNSGKKATTGLRFSGVNVPQGVTITRVVLRVRSYLSWSNALRLKVSGEAADNPGGFVNASVRPSARVKTAARVDWDPAAWMGGNWYESPDLQAVIQESVNRSGWASGNALVLLLADDGSATSVSRLIYAYDSAPANGAELRIEYTTGP